MSLQGITRDMKRVTVDQMEGRKFIVVTYRPLGHGSRTVSFEGKSAYIRANNLIDKIKNEGGRLLYIDAK